MGHPIASPRRLDLAALALLLLLVLLFHTRPLFLGETLASRDLGFFFAPLREITFREIAAGRLPLWNQASLSGLPLAASPNSALGNPFTWLWPLGGTTAIVVATAAAVPVVAFLLLRFVGLGAAASLAGAAILGFGGPARSCSTLPPAFSCFVFVPLALVAVLKLLEAAPEGGALLRRRVALAAFALALVLLAGEPAIGAEGMLLAIPVLALVLPAWSRGVRWRSFAAVGGAGALALLLAAPQILPAARALSRSARGEGFAAAAGPLYWSLPPGRLGTLLVPRLFGDPRAEDPADDWGAAMQDGGGGYFPTIYLGLLPLALLPVALRRREGRMALLATAAALLLALGRHTPIGPALLRFVPPLSLFRYPEKWLVPAAIALAAATALAVERLSREEPDPADRRAFLLGSGGVAGMLVLLLALFVASPAAGARFVVSIGAAPAGLAPRAAAALPHDLAIQLVVALALLGSAWLLRSHRRAAVGLLLAVALADLLQRHAGMLPSSPRSPFHDTDAATFALRETAGGRPVWYEPEWSGAMAARASLDAGGLDPAMPLVGIFHGLRYAGNNEVDRMGPRHAVAWARETARLPWGEEKLARLRAAGVGALLTLSDLDRLPGVERILFPGWSGSARRVYRLSAPRPEGALLGSDGTVSAARATRLEPTRERWEVDSPAGGRFVRARTFDLDLGATVDGATVPTSLADGMFTSLDVPAGRHVVELRYRNGTYAVGALLALVGLALAALLLFGRGALPAGADR